MFRTIGETLAFMTIKERVTWVLLTALRACLALLDLFGVLAIGFVVTSTTIFLTSGSNPDRILEFAGLNIPAVNAATLPFVSSLILFLFLFKGAASVYLTRSAAFFVAKIEARAAKTIAEISFGGDLGHARQRSPEEMMYAIQAGSPAAFNVLLNAVNVIVAEGTLFLLICAGFFLIDPIATFFAIIYFGLVASLLQYLVGSKMEKASAISATSAVRSTTAISDLLSVFRELLVSGRRAKYIEDIYQARLLSAESSATQLYLGGMPRYVIEAALLVGTALFLLGQSLSGDLIKAASVVGVFLTGGFRLTAALLPLQTGLLTIKAALPMAKSAHDILRLDKNSFQKSGAQVDVERSQAPNSPIGFTFESVCFTYAGAKEPALVDVSFDVTPGSQIALIGPSGAGKSTIADLIVTALTPTKGSITWSFAGSITRNSFAIGRVSYVPQRPGLVSGTIMENVALGIEIGDVDRSAVLDSLRLAHLADFIQDLPNGIDTPLGKLKDGMSGGQMQRLGLARALYSQPGLLVIDEATSALDAASESEINKALQDLRGTVTVVLVAHRLSTIQNADQVILVQDGRITDTGKFKEIVHRNPSISTAIDLMNIVKD